MLSLKSAAYKQRKATFFHSKSEFGSAVQLEGNEYLLGGPGRVPIQSRYKTYIIFNKDLITIFCDKLSLLRLLKSDVELIFRFWNKIDAQFMAFNSNLHPPSVDLL